MATKARKPKRKPNRKGDDKTMANGKPGTKAADKKMVRDSAKTRPRKTRAPGK